MSTTISQIWKVMVTSAKPGRPTRTWLGAGHDLADYRDLLMKESTILLVAKDLTLIWARHHPEGWLVWWEEEVKS